MIIINKAATGRYSRADLRCILARDGKLQFGHMDAGFLKNPLQINFCLKPIKGNFSPHFGHL